MGRIELKKTRRRGKKRNQTREEVVSGGTKTKKGRVSFYRGKEAAVQKVERGEIKIVFLKNSSRAEENILGEGKKRITDCGKEEYKKRGPCRAERKGGGSLGLKIR